MFTCLNIESLDLPELEPYRTMRLTEDHRNRGIFVAEGDKVVQRLLNSQHGVVSLLLPPERLPEFEPLLSTRPELITVYLAPKRVLESLTGYPMYQGVLAIGIIPPQVSFESFLGSFPSNGIITALDGISNAENMGVIIRNAGALGLDGVISGENSCSPYLRRAVRNSMGAIFRLPILHSAGLEELLLACKRKGIRIVGAHPHLRGEYDIRSGLFGPVCIVLGSEGYGIRPQILSLCDSCIALPMDREVDSLNVASAAAIFFHAAREQKDCEEKSTRPKLI